ncbi:MAG: SpoIIE family protein phosphatase [Akkermansiaceae bacterium]|jgi:anti-sigma regulatory factor (Ser/Thr protein kinase)
METMSHSSPARSWHWSGPATLQAVREASLGTRRFLTESDLAESDIAAWELVVAEAGNNCVIHQGDAHANGTLDLLVTITTSKVIMRLCDSTPGFDWPDTAELPSVDSESGRGLFLIDALTDSRTYARSSRRNILELERAFSVAPPPFEDMEASLLAMTEELSSCYESLSSIFHFISEARDASSLEDFAKSVLAHLIQSTSCHIGILRIVEDNRLKTLARHGIEDERLLTPETEALHDCLDRWIDGRLDGFPGHDEYTGLVHPFSHEGQPIGTLLLARKRGNLPFNAGEENMIRTFGEFFTQHVLSRRHEEAAIRSSVARHEFELAAAIQRSLLPPPHPPVCGVTATGHCESALSIGGDFYDLIPLEGRGCCFVIADVMGKGVASSMIAAVTRFAIRALGEHFDRPANVLELMARQLTGDLERLEMFVTVVVGVIDTVDGVIRIANAGHCPVIVTNPEGHMMIGPENPPLGIEAAPTYPERVIPLVRGTRLLAFTDGLIDPRNKRRSFSCEDELTSWFATACEKRTDISDLKSALLSHLEYGSSADLMADDQTFVLLSY